VAEQGSLKPESTAFTDFAEQSGTRQFHVIRFHGKCNSQWKWMLVSFDLL